MTNQKYKEFLIPNLLILPMVTHWILPSSLESRMYINFLGVLYYIPNISYLFYIFNYSKLRIPNRNRSVRTYFIILVILFAYVLFRSFFDDYSIVEFLNVIFGNLTFIYLPFLFLLFPLDPIRLDKTKYLFCSSLVYVSLQVILYGLGIMTYTSATGDNLTDNQYDVAGVFRVSTSVGAATGTGIIIAMLGMLTTEFYKIKPSIKIFLIVLATVSLFFTLSRGPILLWLFFICVYVLRLMRQSSLTNKFLVVLVLVGGLVFMNKYGVFDPFEQRTQSKYLETSSDFTSGRTEFNREAFAIFQNSDYMGVGSGKVFPEKQLSRIMPQKYYVRMHDTYLLYFAELGIIGGALVLLFYLFMLFKTDFKKSTLGWGLLLVLLISYNTESVFVMSEYLALVLVIMLATQKWNSKNFKKIN